MAREITHTSADVHMLELVTNALNSAYEEHEETNLFAKPNLALFSLTIEDVAKYGNNLIQAPTYMVELSGKMSEKLSFDQLILVTSLDGIMASTRFSSTANVSGNSTATYTTSKTTYQKAFEDQLRGYLFQAMPFLRMNDDEVLVGGTAVYHAPTKKSHSLEAV